MKEQETVGMEKIDLDVTVQFKDVVFTVTTHLGETLPRSFHQYDTKGILAA